MVISLGHLPPLGEAEVWAIVFALVMMGLDVVVGLVGAFVQGNFASSKMREGLGHKAIMMCVILLAAVTQTAVGTLVGLGVEGIEGFSVEVPLILPVCAYIILMEVGSVLETIGDAYPELRSAGIFSFFASVTDATTTTKED